jgi:alpha-methylacyl-CoA racemase
MATVADPAPNVTARGRRSLAFDLKDPASIATCLDLMESADALFEGFRPGVMERLGLGPDVALARNPRLVYGRMTGWGQTGPLAKAAGHDINYIAISGALDAIGPADKPVPPLNLVGDFGGGALYLAFGLLAGVIHARETGKGQVVDCAMSDGAASLMSMFYGLQRGWPCGPDGREANLLDGGAHFYDTYRCADGGWIALGSIEPQFYAARAGAALLGHARQDPGPAAQGRRRQRRGSGGLGLFGSRRSPT